MAGFLLRYSLRDRERSALTILWTPWHLGRLEVPGRIVRSATWEGLADAAGRPLPALAELLGRLAAGGAGLVTAGFTFVDPAGRALARQCGLTGPEQLDAFRPLAGAIAAAGARSCLQLGHAGPQLWPDLAGRGVEPEGPGGPGSGLREMRPERIGEVIDACARAAVLAREAGFDAVQLHFAHGYLHSAFLSPRTNRRRDGWGGSLAGRARFLVETVAAVRRALGPDYPLWAKWNCADFAPGGLTLEESLAAARRVCRAGLDALEISGGVKESGDRGCTRGPAWPEGYFRSQAARFAAALDLPVGTVGGIRSAAAAAGLVRAGQAFVALSRPLVRRPDLPARWRSGTQEGSGCTSCNRCFLPALRGRGIRCMARGRRR